jgi:hypothetical protein
VTGRGWHGHRLAGEAEPVEREVALKIIKLGMDTREVIRRFEIERQTLAMTTRASPGCSMLATDEGRPYFVMELVAGLPVTEYCRCHALPMRERLDLFSVSARPCSTPTSERDHPRSGAAQHHG